MLRVLIAKVLLLAQRVVNRLIMFLFQPLFSSFGNGSVFFPCSSYFTYKYIDIGQNVFIGKKAWFSSGENARLQIGSDVMFGPGVTVLCGDHQINEIGVRIAFAKQQSSCKGEVVISDDVWVGANTTILKGVTIGTGAVIAAGSLVNKNVLPYSVYGGVPAKFIRFRFNEQELQQHKDILASKYD